MTAAIVSTGPPDRPPRTVLIVEDDLDIRETLKLEMELQGFHVLVAAEGAEALAVLRSAGAGDVSLIVLDLMMPGMNGYDFRSEQLADPALAHIPVLIMTGFGDAAAAAARLGCRAGINKPFSLDTLSEAIARIV